MPLASVRCRVAAVGVTIRFWKRAWWGFVNHRGRRRAKRVGDRQTATKVARALREEFARDALRLSAASADSPTLMAYAEEWLETAAQTLKASTVAFYHGHLTTHVFPMLGTRVVTSIDRQDCRALVVRCRAHRLMATTRGILRSLSTVLTQAVEGGLLPANPAHRMVGICAPGTRRQRKSSR